MDILYTIDKYTIWVYYVKGNILDTQETEMARVIVVNSPTRIGQLFRTSLEEDGIPIPLPVQTCMHHEHFKGVKFRVREVAEFFWDEMLEVVYDHRRMTVQEFLEIPVEA